MPRMRSTALTLNAKGMRIERQCQLLCQPMSWLLVFGVDAPARLPGDLPSGAAADLAGTRSRQTGKGLGCHGPVPADMSQKQDGLVGSDLRKRVLNPAKPSRLKPARGQPVTVIYIS